MGWVLIFVIAVLAAFTFVGLYRGIVKMIFSVISLVVTLIAVYLFSPVLSDFIKTNTKAYDKLRETVYEDIMTEEIFTAPDTEEALDNLKIPTMFKEMLLKDGTAEDYAQTQVSALREYMTDALTDMLFNMAVFVITFVIVFIVLRIILGFATILTQLPIIHGANKIAGAVAGFVMGLAVVWVVFAFLTAFGTSELSKDMIEQVNGNKFLTFIYNNNVIMKYVQSIMK